MTYNQWVELFKEWAAANPLIGSFHHGHSALRHQEKDVVYPFMHLLYNGSTFEETAEEVDFEVLFMDLPVKKDYELSMETDVLSDMKQCAEDLIAELRNGMVVFNFNEKITILSTRVQPLVDEDQHTITGVSLEIKVQIPYTADACISPLILPTGCEDVNVVIGGNLEGVVPSGGTAQIDLIDQLGSPIVPMGVVVTGGQYEVQVNVSGPPAGVIPNRVVPNYQGVSYQTGDLGWHWMAGTFDYNDPVGIVQGLDMGSADPYFTLKYANQFGNFHRFTDDMGVAASDGKFAFLVSTTLPNSVGATPAYVIDHLTGIGWVIQSVANGRDWGTSVNLCHIFTLGGYSDFRLASYEELCTVIIRSSAIRTATIGDSLLERSTPVNSFDTTTPTPLVSATTAGWVSQTRSDLVTQAYAVAVRMGLTSGTAKSTVSSFAGFALRKHF